MTLENLVESLKFYSEYHLENKSAEYHNLWKASILGLLYLYHKFLLYNPEKDHKNVFYTNCVEYAKWYA